jgi:hypothetical protein
MRCCFREWPATTRHTFTYGSLSSRCGRGYSPPAKSRAAQLFLTNTRRAPNDLLFTPTLLIPPVEPAHLQLVTGPVDLGLTEPNAAERRYRHGTLTGYNPGGCKCEHCRGAYATYRAERRAAGKDLHPAPRTTRSHTTDGHIPRSWYANTSGHPPSTPPPSASESSPTTSARPRILAPRPAAPTSKPSKNDSDTAASSPPRNTSTPSPKPTTPPSPHPPRSEPGTDRRSLGGQDCESKRPHPPVQPSSLRSAFRPAVGSSATMRG